MKMELFSESEKIFSCAHQTNR